MRAKHALRRCQQMLALSQDLEEETATTTEGALRGQLRLTCSVSFAFAQMGAAIADFLAQHPQLKIDLDASEGSLNLVEKRIDLAIRLALERGVMLCTYGDTMRVPASEGLSLIKAKARGADVRMVYSAADALALADCTLADVAKVSVWLADARDFGSFNRVYMECFGDHRPARSTVESRLMIDAKVEIDVTNTGKVAGDEVVQLYVHDEAASVTRPVLELKHFKRVTLAPGAKTTVTFEIKPADLSMWNLDMQRVVEPGDFSILVGPNSVDLKKATLTVV